VGVDVLRVDAPDTVLEPPATPQATRRQRDHCEDEARDVTGKREETEIVTGDPTITASIASAITRPRVDCTHRR